VEDLRRLRYFLAVASERNFTRAAERLHLAQPALSRQVRLLEEELGVDLLHRTTHTFELTEAGQFLFERGPALLSAADELWRGVRGFGAGEAGSVVVGYGASAGYETAPRVLQALAERHPGVSIATRVMSAPEIVAGVGDGSLDAGLVRCPPSAPGLEPHVVRHETQGLLLRRDHPLAAAGSASVTDLRDETLLLHPRDANPGHYDAVVELCERHGVEPRILLRNLSFDLAQTPVIQGSAVAIVGESTLTGLASELGWLPFSPPVTLEVALLVRAHNRSPAVDRLVELAGEVAAELGWRDAPGGHAASL
jgi:DNA-binding transcriptional LysR family regulator